MVFFSLKSAFTFLKRTFMVCSHKLFKFVRIFCVDNKKNIIYFDIETGRATLYRVAHFKCRLAKPDLKIEGNVWNVTNGITTNICSSNVTCVIQLTHYQFKVFLKPQ
jgi:hypothetical protein